MEGARPATDDDAPRIAELMAAAIDELRPTRGGDVYATRDSRPTPPPVGEGTWVGTIDDVVVGFIAGRVEELRDGRKLGVVDEVFVESEARSVGVGEAMLGEVLAWFTGQGCFGVDAHALPGNRATKNFFEENGFSARLLVMHHRFEDGRA